MGDHDSRRDIAAPRGHETDPEPAALRELARGEPPILAGARIGHYELIRELGRGGMGVVYLARDTRLGRRVAIKFLLDASRAVADRFMAEARATATCTHDHIVVIHEVGEHAGNPYLVLELLEGETLRAVIAGGRLAPARVVEIVLPIARALARAHELDIVHRDLKPDNVFVTSAGQIKVLDFGIAKALDRPDRRAALDDAGALRLELTHEGALIGTLPYMSPEQLGAGEVDHRSDLWAVGIMMFEMLAGHHPVQPLRADAVLAAIGSGEPLPAIRAVAPDVPEPLAALVDGCLRRARADRIASAGELARRLEALLPHPRARALDSGESPYRGLRAFEEADAGRFFGRSREIAQVVDRLRHQPLLGVIGPSGVGKSSFVRAGVVPALKASGEPWHALTVRPGRTPLATLAAVVHRLTAPAGASADHELAEHAELVRRLRAEPGYLGARLRAHARRTGGRVVVVVDQFEELYTLVGDAGERRAFTAALAGVADDGGSPLRVVVSLRSDFLDRVAEDPRFVDELARGLIVLSPPGRAALREALVTPVELAGCRFETARMIDDMLDALGETHGALPLLQFVAGTLWDARDRDRLLISEASYAAVGGITGALASHADDVLAGMTAAARRLAQTVLRRLVTPERTRAIVELAELHQLGGEVDRVIDQLVAARLLVIQRGGDGDAAGDGGGGGRGGDGDPAATGAVELVHESLIDRWPALRRWLDEDHEDLALLAQLSAAARQWDARGRAPGLLWRGDAMEDARRWYALRPRALGERDQAFLDAVLALARRGRRIRRIALAGSFALLGAIASGAFVGYLTVRAAEREASENAALAEQEAARAKEALGAAQAEESARRAAELDRAAAESSRREAEDVARARGEQVKQGRDELSDKARQLEAALAEAREATAQARAASQQASASEKLAREANARLEQALANERAKVLELQKISTELR